MSCDNIPGSLLQNQNHQYNHPYFHQIILVLWYFLTKFFSGRGDFNPVENDSKYPLNFIMNQSCSFCNYWFIQFFKLEISSLLTSFFFLTGILANIFWISLFEEGRSSSKLLSALFLFLPLPFFSSLAIDSSSKSSSKISLPSSTYPSTSTSSTSYLCLVPSVFNFFNFANASKRLVCPTFCRFVHHESLFIKLNKNLPGLSLILKIIIYEHSGYFKFLAFIVVKNSVFLCFCVWYFLLFCIHFRILNHCDIDECTLFCRQYYRHTNLYCDTDSNKTLQ
ncbi:hypothetical protein AGLY_012885 [Aphis glycines]|uniref:Uncharacterized protein n=1 Tax=Aphis glycines TaxID=307491 RepID=A0A6G0TA16_APHGL|nr:hypothetical protein AGLY_012885 [Aphis glycines]